MIPVQVPASTLVPVVAYRSMTLGDPQYGQECPACGEPLIRNDTRIDVALIYVGGPAGEKTGGAVAIHDTCVPHRLGISRPTVVTLCGSTRFSQAYQAANLRETLAGKIVLSIGCDTRSDATLHAAGELGEDIDSVKTRMDELHLRKIDLSDEIFVINVDGYVGESTAREIAHARSRGIEVRYLEPPAEGSPA